MGTSLESRPRKLRPPAGFWQFLMYQTIVYERSGQWAARWRHIVAEGPPRCEQAGALREARSLAECRELLVEQPAGFLVMELQQSQVDAACQLLLDLHRLAPRVASGVVSTPELAGHEWLLRELGAVHYITSPRKLREMVAVADRHLAGLPQVELSLEDRVWRRLPWPRGVGWAEKLEQATRSARRPAAEELIWEPIEDDSDS